MYTSTRSDMKIPASRAIINGLASDGGLYVIKSLKNIKVLDINELVGKSYKEIALIVLKEYLNDFQEEDIKSIIDEAYDNTFSCDDVVNLKKCKDSYFLELFHGPTMAFKDVALSILPLLLKQGKKIQNDNRKTVILTATSGDTGSAALSGFSKDGNAGMIVLYPTCGVSLVQEKQMQSFRSTNMIPAALVGNFDDAQSLVKKVFSNKEVKQMCDDNDINLSSANSINIGRLIPQIVYYIYSYVNLLSKGEIKKDEKINFVVPTGNFGNILACYMAKAMGVNINKIICASNLNSVLTDFFQKHVYDKNREFYKTNSPSMDILISSNLERLLYYICEDSNLVRELMNELNTKGIYDIPEVIQKGLNDFASYSSNEVETLNAINKVYQENDYLIDTHTAVAYSVYKKYVDEYNDNTKTVIAATAHPFKFPKAVAMALGMDNSYDEFTLIDMLSEKTNVKIPSQIEKLKQEFTKEVWTKDQAFDQIVKNINIK